MPVVEDGCYADGNGDIAFCGERVWVDDAEGFAVEVQASMWVVGKSEIIERDEFCAHC